MWKSWVLFTLLFFACAAFAQQSTPAGASLPNTATANYRLNNVSYDAASNAVLVRAAAIEGLRLNNNNSVLVSPGSAASLPHTLVNTGNTAVQVSISFAAGASASSTRKAQATGSYVPSEIHVYIDANGSGVYQAGDVEILSSTPLTLGYGQTLSLIVVVVTPTTAEAGQSDSVTLTASSIDGTVVSSVTDTIRIKGSDIALVKSASVASAGAGDAIAFTLQASNSGATAAAATPIVVDGASASYVLVRDAIPANADFKAVVNAGSSKVLYHRLGDDAGSYLSAPPADLTQVDAVAFGWPSLAAGEAQSVVFSVVTHANAAGVLYNTGVISYVDAAATTRNSNQVSVKLPGFTPTVSFYNSNYNAVQTVSRVGALLYAQGAASVCNVDPTAADTQVMALRSKLSGDVESYKAVETGYNTGVFRISPAIKTADAGSTAVVNGDGVLEVYPNDLVTVTMTCSGQTAQSHLYLDPAGVVFDSKSNAPVSGAVVTLIDVSGAGNGGHAGQPAVVYAADGVTAAPSTVTTVGDGRFQFPVVAPGRYKLKVTPPNGYSTPSTTPIASLPQGRNIDPSGSYLGDFVVDAATGTVVVDVPADPSSISGLFVEKNANRTAAEIGDFIDYTVKVTNKSGVVVGNINLVDTLPRGLRYAANTGRRDAKTKIDPLVSGQTLTFALGAMASGDSTIVTYRVQVGVGVGTGRVLNHAVASGDRAKSNVASAAVTIGGGVFSDLGYILGRVTTVTPKGQTVGVPGVKVFLEDGSYAITDNDGAYSLFGVQPITHVVKADLYSLPRGSHLLATDNRQSGDGGSVFVDMKFGELRRADFAVAYSDRLGGLIDARRVKNAESSDEVDALHKATLATTVQSSADVSRGRNEIASGQAKGGVAGSNMVAANATSYESANLYKGAAKPAAAPDEPIEKVIAHSNAQLGFLRLEDNQVMERTTTDVYVKGPEDAALSLSLNGADVDAGHVSSRLVYKGVQIVRYINLDLAGGRNVFTVSFRDPFGNMRTASLHLNVPTAPVRIEVIPAPGSYPADGYTRVPIRIRVLDKENLPVAYLQHITLESSAGKWLAADDDEKEDGVQTTMVGGEQTIELLAPTEATEAQVRVSLGALRGKSTVSFIPELRPMTAAGVVEYQLNFSGGSSIQNASSSDGFENSLRLFSAGSGDVQTAARSAVYLKGKILGSDLLTLAYDSNKTSGSMLFRDIQPDQFYPIYGDASVKGFDAQSSSRLYLRVDNGKNYLLYGDIRTQDQQSEIAAEQFNASGAAAGGDFGSLEQQQLTLYNRVLTGAQERWDFGKLRVRSFASYTSQSQVVEEFAANGTSGPYSFKRVNGVDGSETVELWTRDRNQPSVVIKKTPQSRLSDYEFEPFSGRLLFKSPIPTLDDDGNPIFIHVAYEVDDGGPRAWVGGVDAQMQATKRWMVGFNFDGDGNAIAPTQLYGLRTSLKLPAHVTVGGELAGSTQNDGSGLGYRLYYQQMTRRLRSSFFMTRTGEGFESISSTYVGGRGEMNGKVEYAINSKSLLSASFVRTEDVREDMSTVGGKLSFERKLPQSFRLTVGMRAAQTNATNSAAASDPESGLSGAEQVTGIIKLNKDLQRLHRTTIGLSVEQDLRDGDKHDVAVDVATPIPHGKVYARQELISSLGNAYQLNDVQTNYTTRIGIETDALRKAHLFSEYRSVDELTSRSAEAAMGVRQTWKLNSKWRFSASFEHVHQLAYESLSSASNSGATSAGATSTGASATGGSLAVTGSVECNLHGLRCSSTVEYRTSATSNSLMSSFGFGKKITPRWTLLSRNVMLFESSGSGSGVTKQNSVRFQTGAAYRGSSFSHWDALALIEYRLQDGSSLTSTNANMAILSSHVNYQPKRGLNMSFQYATKWLADHSSALNTTSYNQLFSYHVTRDIGKRFDVGFVGRLLSNAGLSQRQNNFGAEVGFRVKQNLWLSTGYNFKGFYERDLPGGVDARNGAYVRLRFKFDENILRAPGRVQLKDDAANLSK